MSSFRACARLDLFQPTLPARGATNYYADLLATSVISTHAPRTGSDNSRFRFIVSYALFQPTLPARGATPSSNGLIWVQGISTHAPRTGSDRGTNSTRLQSALFQPTLPARGATKKPLIPVLIAGDFNPRSPHGERPDCWHRKSSARFISTHAPRTGSDTQALYPYQRQGQISTHAPRTGSDEYQRAYYQAHKISTHAPRTGSDGRKKVTMTTKQHFNPRSPHGERLGARRHGRRPYDFNPRSPHGERRKLHLRKALLCAISTHAPRTGSDDHPLRAAGRYRHFNPRSPHGERRRIPAPTRRR